jgi:hypothetical protein
MRLEYSSKLLPFLNDFSVASGKSPNLDLHALQTSLEQTALPVLILLSYCHAARSLRATYLGSYQEGGTTELIES